MYDVLIKNGKTIAETPLEVAIKDGKIAAVGAKIEAEAAKVLELDGQTFISAGWIDSHVHCFEKMNLYYDYPDEIGVKKG